MPWAILANIAPRTPTPLPTATALWHCDGMATWVALLRGVNLGGANKDLVSIARHSPRRRQRTVRLYANGAGRSKMSLDYFEKRLRWRGTARNLNTVAKLIEISSF